MHLGEMDKVFVVKRGILGVKSRNDGGVHGTWHCYCGVELRENWSIREVQIVQNEAEWACCPGPTGSPHRYGRVIYE